MAGPPRQLSFEITLIFARKQMFQMSYKELSWQMLASFQ